MAPKVVDLKKAITATEQEVLPPNPGRVYALLVNDGDNVIYLGMSQPATANRGIRLNALGGSYEITLINPFTGGIHAVCAGALTSSLVLVEW